MRRISRQGVRRAGTRVTGKRLMAGTRVTRTRLMDETIGYHHLLFIRVTFWYLGVFVYGRGGEGN